MRIRGSLNMQKNTIVALETTNFAVGFGVMETGAAAQAAFPNPATPEGADWDGWMFYRSLNSAIVDAASTIIDVKAMRKVQSGYSLVFVCGSDRASSDDSNVTAPAIAAQLNARILFLLP